MALKIRINRKSVESMTRQLTDQLGDLISSGALAVGSLLPSERTLANSLGVARNVGEHMPDAPVGKPTRPRDLFVDQGRDRLLQPLVRDAAAVDVSFGLPH